MGQQNKSGGGKSGGKSGGGKTGGKTGGKAGGDKSSKNSSKTSQKNTKTGAKGQKKGNNKSSSMVSSCLSSCICIVYSIMVGYLGGTAIKTVGDNPELIKMAAMSSDTRLKKNVKQMNYGLKELTQLEPKSYNYVYEQDSTTRHLGVMAQDLKQIMPELVVEIDSSKSDSFRNTLPQNIRDETLYGVKYQELVPVLINAIKELKLEVDTLKQQIQH